MEKLRLQKSKSRPKKLNLNHIDSWITTKSLIFYLMSSIINSILAK